VRQLWHRLHHDCIRTAGQPSSDEPRLAPGQQLTKFAAELAWNGQLPHAHGFASADAGGASLGLVYQQLLRQSAFLAFMDCFRVIAWLTVTMIPLVFLIRKFKGGGGASTAH
jgi:hypothetical protein